MPPATAELKTEAELKRLRRDELDKYAESHGVDPSVHSNMEGLVEAVPKRDTDDEERPDATADTPAPDADTTTAAGAEQVDQSSPSGDAVEELRSRQLKAGVASGRAKEIVDSFQDATAAEHRARRLGAQPLDGRVDNMTRRSDADVMTGHFCRIDYSKLSKEEVAAVEAVVGEGNAGLGRADYGVSIEAGVVDPDTGYPETAMVLLRDEHAAQITVPYAALLPDRAGGRR